MKTNYLDEWRGHRDSAPVAPESMTYSAQLATRGCKGCVFDGQWSEVCKRAGAHAVANGQPDCDDKPGYIYIAHQRAQADFFDMKGD